MVVQYLSLIIVPKVIDPKKPLAKGVSLYRGCKGATVIGSKGMRIVCWFIILLWHSLFIEQRSRRGAGASATQVNNRIGSVASFVFGMVKAAGRIRRVYILNQYKRIVVRIWLGAVNESTHWTSRRPPMRGARVRRRQIVAPRT